MNKIELGKIAGSAAIIKDKKVLLLKRNTDRSLFPGHWTFASGGIEEFDSSVSETVIREVKEETGLIFAPIKKFGFYESISNNKRHFALVYLGDWEGEIVLETSESSDWKFYSYEDTKELPLAFAYREVLKDLFNAGLIS